MSRHLKPCVLLTHPHPTVLYLSSTLHLALFQYFHGIYFPRGHKPHQKHLAKGALAQHLHGTTHRDNKRRGISAPVTHGVLAVHSWAHTTPTFSSSKSSTDTLPWRRRSRRAAVDSSSALPSGRSATRAKGDHQSATPTSKGGSTADAHTPLHHLPLAHTGAI